MFRTVCFEMFGGFEWFSILIALGRVPDACVDYANEVIARRIREKAGREAGTEVQPGPRLSARSLAASQGLELPPITGPLNPKSHAKKLREEAKRMDMWLRWRGGPSMVEGSWVGLYGAPAPPPKLFRSGGTGPRRTAGPQRRPLPHRRAA